MLLTVYIVSMIVGGVLLSASLLAGHDSDSGLHASADHDADVHVDLGTDHDADVHFDADHADAGHADDHGSADIWIPFLTLRFWVFCVSFFGLTGTALTVLGLLGKTGTLFMSIGVGVISGLAASGAIHWLKRTEVGHVTTAEELVGSQGKLLLPASTAAPGKVRLSHKGQTIDLLARCAEGHELEAGCNVLVVDVDDNELKIVEAP